MKRRRSSSTLVRRTSARSLTKKIVNIDKTAVGTAQTSTTLFTTTFPCTIVGIRYNLTMAANTGGHPNARWAIVRVPDGYSASTISMTDSNDFYSPEKNVLVFGNLQCDQASETRYVEGVCQTSRKMQTSDTLVFLLIGSSATNTIDVHGDVQFFSKI